MLTERYFVKVKKALTNISARFAQENMSISALARIKIRFFPCAERFFSQGEAH